jgi:hypothetical protein
MPSNPPAIARVFPRRTTATPTDSLVFTTGPGLFPPEVEAVHISVTFTWDLPRAEQLAREWSDVAPVTIGGPATLTPGANFTPGLYLKRGYVITSRGCPNRCWFCSVPKREGPTIRELPITEGSNILDDNLLACSYRHVCGVIDMLAHQRQAIQFTGGIEAARLEPWSAEALRSVRPRQVFFAYDEESDYAPLVRAAQLCWQAGFTPRAHRIRAYVLCGWPKDTLPAAQQRMQRVLDLGIIPMAMLWRNTSGTTLPEWRRFQRLWARPAFSTSVHS